MEVIATIVERKELGRITRIAKHPIDVDDAVELAIGTNPVVQHHALGFVLGRVVAGKARIPPEWRQCAADDGKALLVRSSDELTKARDQVID
jgi:hypothetical protein